MIIHCCKTRSHVNLKTMLNSFIYRSFCNCKPNFLSYYNSPLTLSSCQLVLGFKVLHKNWCRSNETHLQLLFWESIRTSSVHVIMWFSIMQLCSRNLKALCWFFWAASRAILLGEWGHLVRDHSVYYKWLIITRKVLIIQIINMPIGWQLSDINKPGITHSSISTE